MDSASDSEKRDGVVQEDSTPERKGDRDLWLLVEGGGTSAGVAGWDKDASSSREEERKRVKGVRR